MEFSSITILTTALSIVICRALFPMACSFIREAFAQMKAERGYFMKEDVYKQLQDLSNDINRVALL